jgi:hypothetical protein
MGTLTQPTSYFSGGFVVNGKLTFDSGLGVLGDIVDDSSGTTIWDSNNDYIPSNALQNDSISINGTDVSLGDSISLSTGVDLGDDEKGTFGTDNDFSIRYDSTADSLTWQDGINTADRMELDRSTGNLDIEGTLTEGSAL